MKRFVDMVGETARRNPDACAVVDGDARLTYSQLDHRVGALGSALRQAGLRSADRVALLAQNELEYVEIQAACARSGFTLVPLNTRLAQPELEFILNDSSPSILIGGRTEHGRTEDLGRAVGVNRLLGLGETVDLESYDAFIDGVEADPQADPLDLDLITTILYTSGTTGRPKGAMIDRAGMTARLFVNAFELGAAPEDVFVESLPMFHISAYLAYAYIFVGATVVMLPVFTPEDCLDVLAREQATSTVLVPTMIRMVMDSPAVADFDASHLQLTIYGGESIEPGLLRRAMEQLGCGFHQQYGMTETGAQTILRPADHDPANIEALSSAGSDAISFEVRIVDGDDRQLPDGEIGEIVCRGPAVMSGYWKRPDATAETLRNGWMHTGDVGYRDGQRLLHIVDRRNDMVVSGGENVYPREVERELLGHPDVADATVIGLPDAKWGEAVTAVVVGEHPSDEDLAAYLRERLAGYKVPRRWIRLDELPRNAGGKVLKGELRRTLKT